MVKGLDLFKENFQPFEDCYTVIGGTACSVLMENATLEFRATQDIDMILLVDSPRFNEFADQLLKFIDDGDYTSHNDRAVFSECFKYEGEKADYLCKNR